MTLHEIRHGQDRTNLPHFHHLYVKYPKQQASRSLCHLISSARGEQRPLPSTDTGRGHCTTSHLLHVCTVLSGDISVILKTIEFVEDQDKQAGKPKTWQSLRTPGMSRFSGRDTTGVLAKGADLLRLKGRAAAETPSRRQRKLPFQGQTSLQKTKNHPTHIQREPKDNVSFSPFLGSVFRLLPSAGHRTDGTICTCSPRYTPVCRLLNICFYFFTFPL